MTILQNLQTIALEINQSLEIKLMEGLHRNLGSARVLFLKILSLEGKIMLNWLSRKLGLVIFARGVARGDGPETDEDGEEGQNGEEDPCFETPADFSRDPPWDNG